MKKIKTIPSFLQCLLIGLFILCIVFTFFMLINTIYVNKEVKTLFTRIDIIPSIKIEDSAANIKKDVVHAKHVDSIIFHKIDSVVLQYKYVQIKDATAKMLETKNFIIDANTMSFFFQIFSLLITGLGLYLLSRIENEFKESKKLYERTKSKLKKLEPTLLNIENLEEKIKNLEFFNSIKTITNDIINSSERISMLGNLLQKDKAKGIYSEDNIRLCIFINESLEKIQKEIKEINELKISSTIFEKVNNEIKDCKSKATNILYDVFKRFQNTKLDEVGNFYKLTLNEIEVTLKLIRKMEIKRAE